MNQEQRITFVLERTVIYVNYEVVQATTGSQLILIRMLDPTPVSGRFRFTALFHRRRISTSGSRSPDFPPPM